MHPGGDEMTACGPEGHRLLQDIVVVTATLEVVGELYFSGTKLTRKSGFCQVSCTGQASASIITGPSAIFGR